MKSLGLACFHFGTKLKKGETWRTEDHIKEIEKTLKLIPSIDEIVVLYDKRIKQEFVIEEPPGELKNGHFFPKVFFLSVSFVLTIPRRIQESSAGESWAFKRTNTEKFRLRIIDTFYGPISIVEPIEPSPETSPSYSVEIVKDFLDSEFEKIESNVTFESVGPSPFSADLYFIENSSEDKQRIIEKNELPKRGFNEIYFFYKSDLFENEEKALSYLIKEIEGEIGLFYRISRRKTKTLAAWDKIEKEIKQIEKLENSPNTSKREKWSLNKKRRDLIDSLYKFEASHTTAQNSTTKDISTLYKKQTPYFFREYLIQQESEFPEHPIGPVRDWLVHGESRALKSLEIWAIMLSAVLGGASGGLVSLLLQK